jgi:DNA-binding NarL/FixJ family response regulator
VADIFALIDDIFFQSKLLETAKHTGVELKAFSSSGALLAALNAANGAAPRLIIIDLNARSSPIETIAAMRARDSQIPVVSFFSHVQTELAQRARDAGCTEILPRSKFTKDLAAIFSRVKS